MKEEVQGKKAPHHQKSNDAAQAATQKNLKQPCETPQAPIHRAYLCLGSNIDPEENVRRAIRLLSQQTCLQSLSSVYETQAVGSSGPNFINMMVCVETALDAAALKKQVLTEIEHQMGRVRTGDKNAPRTIDLDIIVFDDQVIDDALWRRIYIALPCSELLPDLLYPRTGETLKQVARRLLDKDYAIPRTELNEWMGITNL